MKVKRIVEHLTPQSMSSMILLPQCQNVVRLACTDGNDSVLWKGFVSSVSFHFDDIHCDKISKRLQAIGSISTNDVLGMNSMLLFVNSHVFAPVLTALFPASLRTQLVPVDWKFVWASPIDKAAKAMVSLHNQRVIAKNAHTVG